MLVNFLEHMFVKYSWCFRFLPARTTRTLVLRTASTTITINDRKIRSTVLGMDLYNCDGTNIRTARYWPYLQDATCVIASRRRVHDFIRTPDRTSNAIIVTVLC